MLDGVGCEASIEHVGSTSVRGMPAEPITDVDIVVAAGATDAVAARLATYGYVSKGDRGVPGRLVLDPPAGRRACHLYVVERGSKAWFDQVGVRDHLRRSPNEAAAYATEKRRHAHLLPLDRAAYSDAKAAFVERVLSRAPAAAGLTDDPPHRTIGCWWRRPVTDDLIEALHAVPRLPARHLRRADAPAPRIGTALVDIACERAAAAACDWVHVDLEPGLGDFYVGACRFQRTEAAPRRL